ncbi:hypothetical protein KBK19_18035 [Microvirga sp. STR05]|uniref:Uncharacterized protein n=1 Tax=Hymenobacter duratus TaxID=2771356 RepID=A0ABR8JNF6_9BACT|nr:hypothetical protein [Hymenobacter duratus]MBD2716950.1 hypothetical protein [Hymenobacter duratus]MBR7951866.1 hypothetical protein [Microvirga sp. STR05]
MTLTRRRKVRGSKRRLKHLVHQSVIAAPLSEPRLQRYGYDYNKLGLGPWHHRQPPQRVRQLAARHLLTTFFDWQRQLGAQPEPFYLAIWLVDSDFAHSSQVVAGIRERREWYHSLFGKPDPAGPPLPAEYQLLPGADQLTWHPHPREVELDVFDYPGGWPAWALRKPNRLRPSGEGGECMLVQTGWVWVGQATPVLT